MSIVAIVAAEHVQAANSALQLQGFGPGNFGVVCYAAGRASHAALHAWDDPMFEAALRDLPQVTVTTDQADPRTFTHAIIDSQGAQWGADAPEYAGVLQGNTLYKYADDSLWWTIQAYDTAVFADHPSAYPALTRRARRPGVAEPWIQPLDQHDAYKLVNPFTGAPDEALDAQGQLWRVSAGDAAGNNVWEIGDYGWVLAQDVAPVPELPVNDWPTWLPWDHLRPLYQVGAQVTHNDQRWIGAIDNNHWEPGVYGWVAV